MRSRLTSRLARLLSAALAVGLVTVLAPVSSAGADQHGGGSSSDHFGTPPPGGTSDQHIVAEVHDLTGSGTVGGATLWADCTFVRITTEDVVAGILDDLLGLFQLVGEGGLDTVMAILEGVEQTGYDFEGDLAFWYDVTCPNELLEPGGRAIWPVGDAIPQRVVDALARQAVDSEPLPLFYAYGAPAGTVDEPFVTGLETHLWLDQSRYVPVEAVAEIPGLTRVTVTATPGDPVWSPGDGTAPFTCAGPGEPWNDGDDVAECGHVYERSTSTSSSGAFTLAVTTTWTVQYECENLAGGPDCGSQPLPSRVVTSTRPVTVAEIQAVVTDA